LTSCSFDNHGLILTIFGKQHQRTFKNDTHVELSLLSLQFYILYLLLDSCDGNDALWRHSMLAKKSSSFSRKHRTLSLQICVRQTVRLTIQNWRLKQENVCTLYKHLFATPAAVTSDLKQLLVDTWAPGQAYHKTLSTKQLVNGKSGYMQMQAWRQKWHHFEHLLRLFSKPKHYTSVSFQATNY